MKEQDSRGKSVHKRGIGTNVLIAARARIAFTFDNFERVCVSFSGGKDSTVLMHLACAEARVRGRRVAVLFIDWEAQYRATIEHVEAMLDEYADVVDPFWIAVPLRTTNACSQLEPEWTCWAPEREELWVRPRPARATPIGSLPFYTDRMTFEEFVPAFSAWYAGDTRTAFLVGIRADESLNRWRTLTNKGKVRFEGRDWTTCQSLHVVSVFPLYDWKTQDIWIYHARTATRYNEVYDLMHKAGLSIHQMRLCEPYGDEQRQGLWLFHVLEPETWPRVAARVAGANTGALYARERGNVMGNAKISLPPHLPTWEAYARFLLDTMPPPTAEHYRNKIAVWLKWYVDRGYPDGKIPDELPDDLGAKDKPSWRRVCKVLLKNDYWCKGLCFSPTKTAAYGRYQDIMKRRRESWGIAI